MELKLLDNLISKTKALSLNNPFTRGNIKEIQTRTLKRLLITAKNTVFGQQFGFEEILKSNHVYASFSEKVPYGDYLHMKQWWERERKGEQDVSWPGPIEYYALSSGTTDGSSKFIPVSKQMQRNIQKGSIRQLLAVARTDFPKDYLAKHWLMVGGSTSLDYNGLFYAGDLSGIATGKIPRVFRRLSKPEPEIKAEKDWNEKIEKITNEAPGYDISLIAGGPAWIQILLEKIIKTYRLKNIHEIWPNFGIFIHGAVSLKPYKKSLEKLMGKPILYFETYLASEGFIAIQTRQEEGVGMRMLVRNGIFYEFIPFNSDNFTEEGEIKLNPEILPIWECEEGKEYALLITTCSGAWRYLIGDTVRFLDIDRQEIEITGRTKQYISLCGEHLSVENMNDVIEKISEKFNTPFPEFTLIGETDDGVFGHHWFLSGDPDALDAEVVKKALDEGLCELNDDYRVERQHALSSLKLTIIPFQTFIDYLEKLGRLGSQNKFPRVMKGEKAKDWLNFLEETQNQKIKQL